MTGQLPTLLRPGDCIRANGHIWVIAFVLDAQDVAGLPDWPHYFAVRLLRDGKRSVVLYHLYPADDRLHHTATSLNGIYTLHEDNRKMAFLCRDEHQGMFAQLQRATGGSEWSTRWRIAFNKLTGADVPPNANWRQALPGEA
ncbi:hypothetical protein [Mesorhizobium sp.]|uniref:hypothetical protein n=1 Tax=Mesorhizobium sp. TaxID=1871066 RepID=UPI000FD3C7C8|nr:hypothetical protein [Mesorhizobium sp.]RVC64387.1 hypothetical protein EN779_02020 [Mesorhizobium sp. M4B.F.Ca.ET.088.02.2.1]RWF27660.1 MAG: hypothetical protein EOS45_25125 [Mesorhizobium sp.]